jgi:hypothetical protein
MRGCWLGVALALVTVWATGCIIIDTKEMASRTPVTVRSDDFADCQNHAGDTPTLESGIDVTLETTAE